ncbi:hypothetical protein AB0N38_32620 [Micromonospora aurantiaca]|nr:MULTISPECIES: hypothetical protein [Micromonospora]MDG4754141.1 hypothetical protein [Micromonospora sp. WMMD718]
MTHALSPTTVISGAIHHLSVRNVFAAMAARARPPRGCGLGVLADVVVI